MLILLTSCSLLTFRLEKELVVFARKTFASLLFGEYSLADVLLHKEPVMLLVVLLRLKLVELLLNGLESEGEGERVMDVSEGAEESTSCRDSKSLEWALRLGLKRLKILRI